MCGRTQLASAVVSADYSQFGPMLAKLNAGQAITVLGMGSSIIQDYSECCTWRPYKKLLGIAHHVGMLAEGLLHKGWHKAQNGCQTTRPRQQTAALRNKMSTSPSDIPDVCGDYRWLLPHRQCRRPWGQAGCGSTGTHGWGSNEEGCCTCTWVPMRCSTLSNTTRLPCNQRPLYKLRANILIKTMQGPGALNPIYQGGCRVAKAPQFMHSFMQLINATWPHPGHTYINAGGSIGAAQGRLQQFRAGVTVDKP